MTRSVSSAAARPALAAAVLFAAIPACSPRSADGGAALPSAAEWRTFEGTWSASGERRTLAVERGLEAAVLDLAGVLLLTGERGLGVGFQARAIAYADATTGAGLGRAVWTDERGDRIFSELRGVDVATGRRVLGTITGGTGRWTGVTGEYRFDWAWVVDAGEGRVQGRAVGLEGRARLAAAEAAPR